MSLLTDLISYWKLDEASGNAVDSHGSNTLTANNAPGSVAGKIGNARQLLLASNQTFSIADNASLSVGDIDFTFAFWVNPISKVNFPIILSKDDTTANREYGVYFNTVAGGRFEFYVRNAANTSTVILPATSNATAPDGVWTFVVMWHDAVNNQLGLQINNGTAATTALSGGVRDSNNPFVIGNSSVNGGNTRYNGLIDEVGFWKRVLTSQERTDLWNSGNGLAHPFSTAALDTRRRRRSGGYGL